MCFFFFFQAEDGIRDGVAFRGLGDVYERRLFAIPVAVIAIIIKAAVDKKRKKNESNENTADKAEMK